MGLGGRKSKNWNCKNWPQRRRRKRRRGAPNLFNGTERIVFYDATINIVALRWKRESRERIKREEKADEIFSLAPGLQANREINWRIFFRKVNLLLFLTRRYNGPVSISV